MGVGAGLYVYVVVVQKFTFAISSPDEFLYTFVLAGVGRAWMDISATMPSTMPSFGGKMSRCLGLNAFRLYS